MIISQKKFVASLALLAAAIFSQAGSADASNRQVRLAQCSRTSTSLASSVVTQRNGKTVLHLTANSTGIAGFTVLPLNQNFTADKLYLKPTTVAVDYDGGAPSSARSVLFVIIDWLDKGAQQRSVRIAFGARNGFPLTRQPDGTYVGTITEDALRSRKIDANERITKLSYGFSTVYSDNNIEDVFLSNVIVNGELLPISLLQAVGCDAY